jgi:hypothetical protein
LVETVPLVILNARGDLLVLLIVFCKIDKLTLLNTKLINSLIKITILCPLSGDARIQGKEEKGRTDLLKQENEKFDSL